MLFVAGLAFLIHGAGVAAVGKLCDSAPSLWRMVAAAALGAVYAAACVTASWLGAYYWRLGSLLVVAFLAFGMKMKCCVGYVLLFLAIEGLTGLIGEDLGWFGAFGLVGLLWFLSRAHYSNHYVSVELQLGGRHIKLTALRDTGNTLRDPISGAPVLILDGKTSRALTGLSSIQLRQPLEVMRSPPIPGLRLIPYRAVGIAGGLLLGMQLHGVRIGNRKVSLTVAFAPDDFCDSGEFQALTGGTL